MTSVVLPIEIGISTTVAAADAAIASLRPDDDPRFPLVIAAARLRRGLPADPGAVLAEWADRSTSETGRLRYPWTMAPPESIATAAHIGRAESWYPWRPRDLEGLAHDRAGFEARLLEPLILATTIEALSEIAGRPDETGRLAAAILSSSRTKIRRDIGASALERDAWADTWALWCVARHPRALAMLHPFALVIADGYAERASRPGLVIGNRHPFHGEPLMSGSAQLAAGLVALGIEPLLVGRLVRALRVLQHADGGWGDADGPSDVLTTLVAADLLAAIDPSWDPMPTAAFFAGQQRRTGFWRAYGPETAWLTEAVSQFLEAATLPFPGRFRAPGAGIAAVDPRTRLPRYEHFAALGDLAASVDGLASAPFSVAFLDLIGFRAFNNERGMEEGDRVLAEFAAALADLPGTIAVRDGGDEFLVVGTPGGASLADVMGAFLAAWPARFAARFGVDAPLVASRVLLGTTKGSDLVALRNRLGREIGELKAQRGSSPRGFLVTLE